MRNSVLLVNPWITDFAAYDFWLKPLGLLYIAGTLRKFGYEISLIDCMNRADPELLKFQGLQLPENKYFSTGKFYREIIQKPELYHTITRNYARYGLPLPIFRNKLHQTKKPDVVLMTSGMTYWYPGVHLAIKEIRNTFSGVPVVLGGIYSTLCRKHALETSGADYVIFGEGELATLKMVDSLTGQNRNYDTFSEDLDSLPYPAFDLYDNLSFVPILTSRGCPLKCTFCASNLISGKHRLRNPFKVIEEICYYYKYLGIREFAFYDDALLTDHKNHLAIILDEIIKMELNVSFHTPNGLQCKLLTENIADKMFHAGFKTIRLSYESGSPERQKDMCRKVTNETFSRAVKNLHKAGYKAGSLGAYVMVALPEQSIEEILWSLAYVHAGGAKIRLAYFSPIPGTVEWQRAKLYYGWPENADPLLSNNTIIPVKPSGTTLKTFEMINILAKTLNSELIKDKVHRDVSSLVNQMKKHCSTSELNGVKAHAV